MYGIVVRFAPSRELLWPVCAPRVRAGERMAATRDRTTPLTQCTYSDEPAAVWTAIFCVSSDVVDQVYGCSLGLQVRSQSEHEGEGDEREVTC